MTLARAGTLRDLISEALLKKTDKKIKEFNIRQLDTALKIIMADEYTVMREGRLAEFREGIRVYGGATWSLMRQFDSFDGFIEGTMELKPDFAHLETGESFGAFLEKLGDSPTYWKQVYHRLGMDWTEWLPYSVKKEPSKLGARIKRLFSRSERTG